MMPPLSVVCWKWGSLFSPDYVSRLKLALDRHLHVPFTLFCVTDDPAGIDASVEIVPLPTEFNDTPRCRRRMRQFDFHFAKQFGPRILAVDLDMVIVDDITPLVFFKINYAKVFSGSFMLMTPGALHGLWLEFLSDPLGYPAKAWPRGIGSDQAMLNFYLKGYKGEIPHWTEADGLITYFGKGYERFEHHGVGPGRPKLPTGAKVVVLGSDDKHVLESGEFTWARTHWLDLLPAGSVA